MTNPALITWLVLGGVLTYVVAVDPNVYHWIELQSKVVGVWLRRRWFLLRYNPDSPWVRWEVEQNAQRLANELLKEDTRGKTDRE